jgi:hypothetical protein
MDSWNPVDAPEKATVRRVLLWVWRKLTGK